MRIINDNIHVPFPKYLEKYIFWTCKLSEHSICMFSFVFKILKHGLYYLCHVDTNLNTCMLCRIGWVWILRLCRLARGEECSLVLSVTFTLMFTMCQLTVNLYFYHCNSLIITRYIIGLLQYLTITYTNVLFISVWKYISLSLSKATEKCCWPFTQISNFSIVNVPGNLATAQSTWSVNLFIT